MGILTLVSNTSTATAASQARYENIGRLAVQIRMSMTQLRAAANYTDHTLIQFPGKDALRFNVNRTDPDFVNFYAFETPSGFAYTVHTSMAAWPADGSDIVIYLERHVIGTTVRVAVGVPDGAEVYSDTVLLSTLANITGAGTGVITIPAGTDAGLRYDLLSVLNAPRTGNARFALPLPTDTDVVGLYDFRENSGTTAADAKAGGTALTLSGGATLSAGGSWNGVSTPAILSAATGLWSASSTWVGGVVPGNGASATIANGHTVTIDGTVIVGNAAEPSVSAIMSGTTAGTYSNTGTGVLALTAAANLTLRGHVQQGNAAWTIAGGALVEFDAAETTLRWEISHVANGRLICNGTAGSRVVIRSNSAGMNARFVHPGSQNEAGTIQATHTNFLRIGTAAISGFEPHSGTSANKSVWFRNCLFDACGQIHTVLQVLDGATWNIDDCLFRGGVAEYDVHMAMAFTPYTSGSRRVVRSDMGAMRIVFGGDVELTDSTFRARSGANSLECAVTTGLRPEWRHNVFAKRSIPAMTIPGGTTAMARNYLVYDSGVSINPHGFGLNSPQDFFFDGLVIDGCGITDAGDSFGDLLVRAGLSADGGGVNVLDVRNVLLLPTATGLNVGKLINIVAGPAANTVHDIRVENNTVFSSGGNETGALAWGNVWVGAVGACTTFRNNLAVRTPNGVSGALLMMRISTGTIQDFVAPANVQNNHGHNLSTGTDGLGFDALITTPTATMFTTPPEAPTTGDPQFVDPTRTMITWSTSIGGVATIDGAFAEIQKRNDPGATPNPLATPAQLYDWVRAGYAPQNAELRTNRAVANSGWIGAMEGFTAPPPSPPSPPLPPLPPGNGGGPAPGGGLLRYYRQLRAEARANEKKVAAVEEQIFVESMVPIEEAESLADEAARLISNSDPVDLRPDRLAKLFFKRR